MAKNNKVRKRTAGRAPCHFCCGCEASQCLHSREKCKGCRATKPRPLIMPDDNWRVSRDAFGVLVELPHIALENADEIKRARDWLSAVLEWNAKYET